MDFKQSYLLFTFVILLACKNDCKKVYTRYKEGTNGNKSVFLYPECRDKSNFILYTFSPSGQLIAENYFRNDLKNGIQKYWYENKQIKSEAFFSDNMEHGISKWWDKNGTLRSQRSYEFGAESGIQKCWNMDGKLIFEGSLINCNKTGTWKYWEENDEYTELNYVNDILNGSTIEILKDKRQVFGQYNNGLEEGQWIWKDSLGNLEQIAFYKKGVYDSIAIAYYPNGSIRAKILYKNGKEISNQEY